MAARFPDKYIIGLTGNIATGKSVVRKMLEHLGALGIDADRLSHAATAKGAPAYKPVVQTFGQFILAENGEIDRKKLGSIVFSNPAALAQLEKVVHPVVRQAVEFMVKRASQKVIVIEAIKLLEGDLASYCDSIWVTDAPPEQQAQRMVTKRKMTQVEALQRIQAQNAQTEKIKRANVVIRNDGSVENTWKQVQAAWNNLPLDGKRPAEPTPAAAPAGALVVRRCGPGDSQAIAQFINTVRGGKLSRVDVLEAFGDKAYFTAEVDGQVIGLAGWQVENLVTRVPELFLANGTAPTTLTPLLAAVEKASHDLQSEAALVFAARPLAQSATPVFKQSGYSQTTPDEINIVAWREAAAESQPENTVILFKKLREDRVLRPV